MKPFTILLACAALVLSPVLPSRAAHGDSSTTATQKYVDQSVSNAAVAAAAREALVYTNAVAYADGATNSLATTGQVAAVGASLLSVSNRMDALVSSALWLGATANDAVSNEASRAKLAEAGLSAALALTNAQVKADLASVWSSVSAASNLAVSASSGLSDLILSESASWAAVGAATNALASRVSSLESSKQDRLSFDSSPTAGSSNPVTSSGIKSYVDAKTSSTQQWQTVLSWDSAPSLGSFNPVYSTGIYSALLADRTSMKEYSDSNYLAACSYADKAAVNVSTAAVVAVAQAAVTGVVESVVQSAVDTAVAPVSSRVAAVEDRSYVPSDSTTNAYRRDSWPVSGTLGPDWTADTSDYRLFRCVVDGPGTDLVASSGEIFYRSSDSGATWTRIAQLMYGVDGLAYGNGVYLVVSDTSNRPQWTSDFSSFTGVGSPASHVSDQSIFSSPGDHTVAFGNGKFLWATRHDGILYSSNGTNFVLSANVTTNFIMSVDYCCGYYFAGAGDGTGIYRSGDGVTWTRTFPSNSWNGVVGNGSVCLAWSTTDYSVWMSSDTGLTWTRSSLPSGDAAGGSIAAGAGVYLSAPSSTGRIYWSNDGSTWALASPSWTWWKGLHVTGGGVAVGCATVDSGSSATYSARSFTFTATNHVDRPLALKSEVEAESAARVAGDLAATNHVIAATNALAASANAQAASAIAAEASRAIAAENAKQNTLTYDTDVNLRSIHTQYAQLDNQGNLTDLSSIHLSYGNSWESILSSAGVTLQSVLDGKASVDALSSESAALADEVTRATAAEAANATAISTEATSRVAGDLDSTNLVISATNAISRYVAENYLLFKGGRSLALGDGASANQYAAFYSLAVGTSATASGLGSAAVGVQASATALGSLALGNNITSSNASSIVLGTQSAKTYGSHGDNSVTLVANSLADLWVNDQLLTNLIYGISSALTTALDTSLTTKITANATAIANEITDRTAADTALSTALTGYVKTNHTGNISLNGAISMNGCGGYTQGANSIAISGGAASGSSSIAINGGTASGSCSIAINGGNASGDTSLATSGSTASGSNAIAWNGSTALGDYSLAMFGSQALQPGSIAIYGATSSDSFAFSFGSGCTSHGSSTFNINPTGGASGFYIGDKNLQTYLSTAPNTLYQKMTATSAAATGTNTIALAGNCSIYTFTPTNASTLAFTVPSDAPDGCAITFELSVTMTNTASAYSLSWPSNVTWLGGDPDMSSTNVTSLLVFRSLDKGATWIANKQGEW